MKTVIPLLVLVCFFDLSAQRKKLIFGDISQEELEMAFYEKDPEAQAVVLYDAGSSVFVDSDRGGYDIRFTRHKRLKIFDKSAHEQAVISMPYYVDGPGRSEVVRSVEATTYNLVEGKILRKNLDPQAVYTEQVSSRWYNKKFVFPDVQDGSVLEVRYVLETPFHFNLPDWEFQDRIPTIYSEYQVGMIPFYEYELILQGVSKFDYENARVMEETRTWGSVIKARSGYVGNGVEFQDYVYTYALRDVPGFKDESYITSINDYIIKLDFQLSKIYHPIGGSTEIISTWPALNKALLKHDKFGKYLKNCSPLARKMLDKELNLANQEESQKADRIIEYVKKHFTWNGYSSKYASQSPKEFAERKVGNSADINLMLIAILKEADISSQPVILSTRGHGRIPDDYPFDHFTNYVVAMVESETAYLADATEDLLQNWRLPTRCLNGRGLLVSNAKEAQWLNLNYAIPSLRRTTMDMVMDTETMDLKVRASRQMTEYEGFATRNEFEDDTVKLKAFFSQQIGSVHRVKTINFLKKSLPYSISMESEYETEKLGKRTVVKPFLDLPIAKNGLTQEKRNYPVDFVYPWSDEFVSSLEIPEGYTVRVLPKGLKIDNDLADIALYYTLEDNVLKSRGHYKFKKAKYSPRDYRSIREYLDKVVNLFNQQILIEEL